MNDARHTNGKMGGQGMPRLVLSTLIVLFASLLLLAVAPPAGALTLVTTSFSDDTGWNQPQYYTTIGYPRFGSGSGPSICGRAVAGIFCVRNTSLPPIGYSNGRISFTSPYPLMTPDYEFSDYYGWGSSEAYYGTIQFADINGDGYDDVCGRGYAGIICKLYNPTTGLYDGPNIWGPAWSNADYWNQPQYYRTIQFVDINGDGKADVCARGVAGVYCAISYGTSFGPPILVGPTWSDAAGGNQASVYSTIQFADIDGDGKPDLCGRTPQGVRCAKNYTATYSGTPAFVLLGFTTGTFSDASGWDNTHPERYRTIQFVDINGDGKADVCGRDAYGILCLTSQGTSGFSTIPMRGPAWSDADSWNQPQYYTTIRFDDLNGDGKADVCGRWITGVQCAFSQGSAFGVPFSEVPGFSDQNGWNQPQYYSTIRMVNNLFDGWFRSPKAICGRGSGGIWCEQY